jgi:DNA-binding NarL/FixJ family response regulator
MRGLPNSLRAARREAISHRPSRPRDRGRIKPVTPRELEVIELVCEGHDNESISHQLDISEETVKRHLSTIFDKLEVRSRLELAVKVLKRRHAQDLAIVRRECDIFDLQSN